MDRGAIQDEAVYAWENANYIGTLLMGTGVGKSYTSILAIKSLLKDRILLNCRRVLILVSDQNLRDNSWLEEFKKFKMLTYYRQITIACYQTAKDFEGREWELVIADEFDFALTNVYSRVFTNNKIHRLLGLTGFIDPAKQALADKIAPVVYTFSTQLAQDTGILNKTILIGVTYELSSKKDITIKHKGGSFTTSENDQYAYIEKKLTALRAKVSSLYSAYTMSDYDRIEIAKSEKSITFLERQRSEMLSNCDSGAIVARLMRDRILTMDNSKVLIFSNRKTQAAKTSSNVYVSGSTVAEKTRRAQMLVDLNNGTIRDMSLCKALDRGANLVGINAMIHESFNSSKTSFQQRHGRGCRLSVNDVMYLIVLVPYYKKKVKDKESGVYGTVLLPTQARKWATSMMAGFKPSDVKQIKYNEVK